MLVPTSFLHLEGYGTHPIGYGGLKIADNRVLNVRYSANWIIFTVFLADNYNANSESGKAVFSLDLHWPDWESAKFLVLCIFDHVVMAEPRGIDIIS
jgi:hypothetical protein